MARLLAGYGDEDFESLFIQTIMTIDDPNSVDDYNWTVNNSGQLLLKKGDTQIALYSTSAVDITNLDIGTTTMFDTINVGVSANHQVLIGDKEVKWRGTGIGHFSAINDEDRWDLRDTSASGNLGAVGNTLFSILGNGNVGIGTTTPGFALDVIGDINSTGTIQGDILTAVDKIRLTNSSTFILNNSNDVDIFTSTINRFTIESGGDIRAVNSMMVGTDSSPTSTFCVSGNTQIGDITTDISSIKLMIRETSDNPIIGLQNGGNSINGMQIVSGDGLRFGILSGSDLTNRMTIDSGGIDVTEIINNFTTAASGSPGLTIRKSNTATTTQIFQEFYRSATDLTDGTLEGDIRLDGAGNLAFNNVSDSALKQNVVDYIGGSAIVKALRAVNFDWIAADKPNGVKGFIAQELETHLPLSVGLMNGYKSITHSEIIPTLWSALRQQLLGVNVQSNGDVAIGDTIGQAFDIGNNTYTTPASIITRWSSGIGTGVAGVLANGDFKNDTGVYSTWSDATLKQDIVDCNSQWKNNKQYRFVNYKLKKEVLRIGANADTLFGVIAQEVETFSPGLVSTDEDGIKSVKTSIISLRAVKTLQEAQLRIETLEDKVETLENDKINLQSKMDDIEIDYDALKLENDTLKLQMINVIARLDLLENV